MTQWYMKKQYCLIGVIWMTHKDDSVDVIIKYLIKIYFSYKMENIKIKKIPSFEFNNTLH